jgi:succinyl-diaminopimelate desuccinylase
VSRRDLVAATATLVDVPSVSHHETAIADLLETELVEVSGRLPGSTRAEVWRGGDNLVARTVSGAPTRLILAGHLDTVPANHDERATIVGDACHGLGAVDMKGGVAVLAELWRHVGARDPELDCTFIFYACEEVEQVHSGLQLILRERPDLLAGDAAVLCEPTSALVEAGCQGVVRFRVEMHGERAHTARPWMGRNAIHRLGPVLHLLDGYRERRPALDGCEYRESLQAVEVLGGVAGNVVPDRATVKGTHRFAPDRDAATAFASIEAYLAPALDREVGDRITCDHTAPAAAPSLDHPLLARLVAASGGAPRAKLGWTDVAFFSGRGIPAANFGPGDPLLAHSGHEQVARSELDGAYDALAELIGLR